MSRAGGLPTPARPLASVGLGVNGRGVHIIWMASIIANEVGHEQLLPEPLWEPRILHQAIEPSGWLLPTPTGIKGCVGIGHRDLTHPSRVKWSPILKLKLTYMDHVSLFPLGLKKDFLTMCQILRLRYTSVSKHMPISICWGILTEPRTNQSANFCSFCPTNTKSTCNFGTGF